MCRGLCAAACCGYCCGAAAAEQARRRQQLQDPNGEVTEVYFQPVVVKRSPAGQPPQPQYEPMPQYVDAAPVDLMPNQQPMMRQYPDPNPKQVPMATPTSAPTACPAPGGAAAAAAATTSSGPTANSPV